MKKNLLLLSLILTSSLYCQQFKLTDINSTEYSIDKIAQQVYFKDFYTDTVRKVDLRDMTVTTIVQHSSLPFFANKHHFMLWGNNSYWGDSGDSSKDNIYLYNLDNHSYYQVTDTLGFPYFLPYYGSFSPNDSNFVYPGFCFSLKDSSLKPFLNTNIDYNTNDAWPQWNSDTSLVFLTGGNPDSVVAEYFLKSGKSDTLLKVYGFLSGFSYNRKDKILAYTYSINSTPSKIYFHYVNKNIPDSLIFVLENQIGAPSFTSLRWSPNDSKLAFVSTRIDIGSEIYVYDLDSSKVYSGGDGGYIDHIKWANNDTLIFVNTSQFQLYGLNVSSIYTSVREIQNKRIPNEFRLFQNYPNPFNPATIIQYSIPSARSPLPGGASLPGEAKAKTGGGLVTLKVYDILGREIATLVNDEQKAGNYEVEFNGANLSSGVYFYQLRINNQTFTKSMILLK